MHTGLKNVSARNCTMIFIYVTSFSILTLGQLCFFIWETTSVKRRIPDQSTEPYPPTKTENRLGTQRSFSGPFRYIHNNKHNLKLLSWSFLLDSFYWLNIKSFQLQLLDSIWPSNNDQLSNTFKVFFADRIFHQCFMEKHCNIRIFSYLDFLIV